MLLRVFLDRNPDAGRQRYVAILPRLSVLQRAVLPCRHDDLLLDAVDVIRDEVVEVDGCGFTIAESAAAHQVDDQLERVVSGFTQGSELGQGRDDCAGRIVLRRLDAGEWALCVEAELMRIQEYRPQLVEGVGLSGQTRVRFLHGPDEAIDHLVVEAVHPSAAERRQDVVLQE
ncbi:hypothetical protein ACFWYX_05500 [[Kitasatospora] papulosa]|uniref:hypothetical protein n=1 Tax=[Kitasatospora] papulosa TaxID=1464011 RepID=UPI0036A2DC50